MLPSPPPGFADLELIGQGATSRVYRALDRQAKRPVALKRLHRQLIRDEETLARMRRELEALGQLRHPSIVAVFGVISWQGDPTIVMELVEGQDLKERILDLGALPGAEAERIARALLDALSAAHAAGIVHRDVKPQNIRLAKDGRVVLLDFGSARLDAASALTATGTTVGTPEYMAPELFVAPSYDPRGDLYGVGATLFESVAGRPPFVADSLAELAFAKSSRSAPPIAGVVSGCPPALALVIDKCLARAPDERFPSAARALWTLDHPAAERLLSDKRRALPLCLHCSAAIGADSAVCPSCGSGHPFSYRGGRVDVFLVSMDDEARLIDYLLARFPERATPERLRALVRSIHGLSRRRQRLISMIDEGEAAALVRELAEIEVRATISPSRGRSTSAFLIGLAGGIQTSVILDALPFLGHHPFLPLVTGALTVFLVLGLSLWKRPKEILGPGPAPRLRRDQLPQPGWRQRLPAVVGGGGLTARVVGPSFGDRALARVTFGLGIALIPVELWAINGAGLLPVVATVAQVAPATPLRPAAPGSVTPSAAPPSSPARPGTPAPVAAPTASPSQSAPRSPPTQRRAALSSTPLMVYVLPALLLAVFAGLLFAQRRNENELAELEQGLGMDRILGGPHKQPPRSRRPATPRERLLAPAARHTPPAASQDSLSAPIEPASTFTPPSTGQDPFLVSQRVAASGLALGLSEGDRTRLFQALGALEKSAGLVTLEQASLHARALRETDPDQKLRFDLLQLMGEMEAKAALAWAEALDARTKLP